MREESQARGRNQGARDEWTLLAVETEANGDSRCTYKRGTSLIGSFAHCDGTIKNFVLPWLLLLAHDVMIVMRANL
jgi:hypothetical protein